jgi:hypothetical protein
VVTQKEMNLNNPSRQMLPVLPEMAAQSNIEKVKNTSENNNEQPQKPPSENKKDQIKPQIENPMRQEVAVSNTDNQRQQQPQIQQPFDDDNVCKLPKAEGDCPDTHERYYFNSESKKCLVFVYTGCKGNENNFDTIESCNSKCLH